MLRKLYFAFWAFVLAGTLWVLYQCVVLWIEIQRLKAAMGM